MRVWSSPHIRGEHKVNPFSVNILTTRAMQATGNRQTTLNDAFSMMNISRRALHTKMWQSYFKGKLASATDHAARNVTTKCMRSVHKLYQELCLSNFRNIAVSCDGSWMTSGHSSHIGVSTVVEPFTGLCLDYVVLSNFSMGCETGPNEGDPSFQIGKEVTNVRKTLTRSHGKYKWRQHLFYSRGPSNGTIFVTLLY